MANLLNTPRDILPPELENRIYSRLIGSEQVLWWGRPFAERTRSSLSLASPIGLAIVALAVYWSYAGIQEAIGQAEPDWSRAWWGLPLFALGIGVLLLPVWATALAGRTLYVLTNGRAMVFHALPLGFVKVEDYFPAQLRDMVCTEDECGSGDLVFEQVESADADGMTQIREFGFIGVENVRAIEALIRATFTLPRPELHVDKSGGPSIVEQEAGPASDEVSLSDDEPRLARYETHEPEPGLGHGDEEMARSSLATD